LNAAFDLLVIGDANPDIVLAGVPTELAYAQTEQLVTSGALTVGGSAAIMACGAARLGLRTAFVALVGDDAAGRFMIEELHARGVDTRGLVVGPGTATGLTVHLVGRGAQRDRAVLTAPGCIGELKGDQVDRQLLRAARHVHVGSFYLLPRLTPALPGLFAEAKEAGLTTSLDTQGDSSGRWQGGLQETLRTTDFAFANEDEAKAAAGGGGLDEALVRLAALGPTPVVKRGAEGAVAYTGGRVTRAAALPMSAVDTVGAGDSFDAGFLCGHLAGWDVARSLALGVACGSLSTRAAGGVDGQPTLTEALAAAG
jgi:sugar/nucleoside kinase (ribokinase family)